MKRDHRCIMCRLKAIVNDPEANNAIRHGSAHNTFGDEDDLGVTETTPLVRFPPTSPRSPWATRTTLGFGVLITLLVLGSLIGIYLLYVQDLSDNVIPPVDTRYSVVPREKWSNLPPSTLLRNRAGIPSKQVIVVQTGTKSCNDTNECIQLLRKLQGNNGPPLPYNFLVASNGVTFEALGWGVASPMYPRVDGIVIAFIGDFTKEIPTASQVEEVVTLFDKSTTAGRLVRDFTIVGKVTDSGRVPTYLFESLQHLSQWDQYRSDEYNPPTANDVASTET